MERGDGVQHPRCRGAGEALALDVAQHCRQALLGGTEGLDGDEGCQAHDTAS
jgi:hypothetical protein